MQAIIFCGLPGSGKSSLYKKDFFATNVRISLDLLRSRYRERRLLSVCLETKQPLVIDNTNVTREERSRYLEVLRISQYRIMCYYFQSTVSACLERNRQRVEAERAPEVAIFSKAKQLEIPSLDEGYDELFYVRLNDGNFMIERWRDEV